MSAAGNLSAKAEELGSPVLGRQFADESTFRPLLYLGRAEEALARLAQAYEMAGVKPNWEVSVQRALCLAHMGRRAEAREALEELLEERDIRPETDETPTTFLASLLEASVLAEVSRVAQIFAQKLSSVRNLAADSSYLTCIARHLGGAAALAGSPDEARAHYQNAVELTLAIRNRPETALSRLQLAQLLLESYPEDRKEAGRHLEFARAEFRSMKMQRALELTASLT